MQLSLLSSRYFEPILHISAVLYYLVNMLPYIHSQCQVKIPFIGYETAVGEHQYT